MYETTQMVFVIFTTSIQIVIY